MERYRITLIKAGSLLYYRGGFTADQEEYKTRS